MQKRRGVVQFRQAEGPISGLSVCHQRARHHLGCHDGTHHTSALRRVGCYCVHHGLEATVDPAPDLDSDRTGSTISMRPPQHW